MCPVCLATISLYVAGGVSAGGITSYLVTRLLPKGTIDAGHSKEGETSDDNAHDRIT